MSELRTELNTGWLTERERQVVDLRRQGLSYREIAEQLGITRGTVSTYIGGINDRLQGLFRVRPKNSSEMIKMMEEHGWFVPGEDAAE